MVVTFSGLLVQSCCQEGATLQTNTTGVYGKCSQGFSLPGFAPARCVCAFILHFSGSMLLCRELSEAGPGLHLLPRSKLLGSGSWVLHKAQTWLGLRLMPFPGLSSSGDQVLGERSHTQVGGASYRLPCPSCLVF